MGAARRRPWPRALVRGPLFARVAVVGRSSLLDGPSLMLTMVAWWRWRRITRLVRRPVGMATRWDAKPTSSRPSRSPFPETVASWLRAAVAAMLAVSAHVDLDGLPAVDLSIDDAGGNRHLYDSGDRPARELADASCSSLSASTVPAERPAPHAFWYR